MPEYQLGFQEYREIDALNWSTLKLVGESPKLCRYREKNPRPDTSALSLGRKIHFAILQPDIFDEVCVKRPSEFDSYRTKAARAWRDEQIAAGREVLTDEDADIIEHVRDALLEHEDAMEALYATRREETILWDIDGVACKGRVDALRSDHLIDLKTCGDLGKFLRDAERLDYHGQLAWYRDGAIKAGRLQDGAKCSWVIVETSEPWDVAKLDLGDYSLDAGQAWYLNLLDIWRACKAEDIWPGRYPNSETVEMSRWAHGMRPEGEEDF